MGVFSKDYEKEAEELWKEVEKDLRPKDGLKHTLMTSGHYDGTDYNVILNYIIEKMQKQGFSIIDVKLIGEGYRWIRTLVTYE